MNRPGGSAELPPACIESAAMSDPVLETLLLPFLNGTLDLPKARGSILFLRARAGADLKELPEGALVPVQSFAPDRDALAALGYTVLHQAEGEGYPLVLVLPPRQKQEARALLADAVRRAAPGGLIVVCATNAEGGKALEGDLESLAGLDGKLSKAKCRVAWTIKDEARVNGTLVAEWVELDAVRPILDGQFVSRPGVFAWDHIDAASALLAANLPSSLSGEGADLGAGFGYLSTEVLKRCAKVTGLDLYEAEQRALDLARENVTPLATGRRLGFHWVDVTKGLNKTYDFIVTNPPFHQTGKAGRTDIGQGFVRAAARSLKPGGHLWLVANRHLPYEGVINEVFAEAIMVADEGGYKVIHARKARGR